MHRECRERFPRHRLQRKPLLSDPDMHHGTCVSHMPWCMSGSLTRGGGENVPGACATLNFTYLARGPLPEATLILLYNHYSDVIMSAVASQITGVSIVCLAVCSGADQWKHPSFASLAFVRVIHQWLVNSPHKGPVMRKMFPFDHVVMALSGVAMLYMPCWKKLTN